MGNGFLDVAKQKGRVLAILRVLMRGVVGRRSPATKKRVVGLWEIGGKETG